MIRGAIGTTAIFGVYFALPLDHGSWWPAAVFGACLLAATVPLTVGRLLRVLGSERPALDAVEALAFLLALLVVGFASLYLALDHDEGQMLGLDTHIDALYFTLTTLSTVGFGDISAAGQLARAAVMVQIVFNLAFVGAVVRVFAAAVKGDRIGRLGANRAVRSDAPMEDDRDP